MGRVTVQEFKQNREAVADSSGKWSKTVRSLGHVGMIFGKGNAAMEMMPNKQSHKGHVRARKRMQLSQCTIPHAS